MQYEIKGNYFNGSFVTIERDSLETAPRFVEKKCPADLNLELWKFPISFDHIDAVIESANLGFEKWRKTSVEERIECLQRFKSVVKEREQEIATAIALESGKPLWEAMTEAKALSAKVDVTIAEGLPRINNKVHENILPKTRGHVFYKPIGPCFVIGPFNFPCHLANGQIINALVSGNSVIFKPSDKTAYSGQILVECFHQAEFPSGVVNLIQGDGEVARRILREKSIKGIFFTGSKEVGLKVLKETYMDLSKNVNLELGGKNPSIITDSVSVDNVLPELLRGSFLTAGQRCTSTSLVVVHENIINELIDKFHKLAKKLIVDHPIDHAETPFMGPLIDQRAVDTYLLFVGMGSREGLEEVMRGKSIEKATPGHYVSPSIHLAKGWDPKSHFLTNEIFGPNATFIPYKDLDEAFAIANSTEYGLAASIFSKEHGDFERAIQTLDSGLVNFNRSTVGASSKLPFGGVKNSGNYKPAAITTIDHCVYQVASLEVNAGELDPSLEITGLKKD
jgi:succinylglutamic semialdehyde dehydrogenase